MKLFTKIAASASLLKMNVLHNLGVWLENNIFPILFGMGLALFLCWTTHGDRSLCGFF